MIDRFIHFFLSIIYLDAVWLTFIWWVNIYTLSFSCWLGSAEFGVFVDHRGQRSRQSDIKWSGLPLSFCESQLSLTGVSFNKCWMKVLGIHTRYYKNLLTMFLSDNNCLGLRNGSIWFVWGGLHLFSGSNTERRYHTGFQEKSKECVVPSSKVWLND